MFSEVTSGLMLIVVGLHPCSLKIVDMGFFDGGVSTVRKSVFEIWVQGKMSVLEVCLEFRFWRMLFIIGARFQGQALY